MRVQTQLYKKIIYVFFTCLVIQGLISCKQEVVLVNSERDLLYQTSSDALAVFVGDKGKANQSFLEFKNNGSFSVYLQLTKPAEINLKNKIAIDESVLTLYNEKNGTNFKLFPKELVALKNEGTFEVKPTERSSGAIEIGIKSNNTLVIGETYVIPFSTKLTEGKNINYLLFIKDNSALPTREKSSGIKIISCMEVNDTNPLNNLSLSLKNSGKPLVDIVILFSSNINYDENLGKLVVTHNPNVTHLLENKDKYLKPLKDRGIKVILSILGNHDRSGVANLDADASKAFAKQIAATCNAYDLDGVFFDDEYSKYIYQNIPKGFVTPSNLAAARLCYDTKQTMPNKLVMVYVYGRTSNFGGLNALKEAAAGEYIDYAIHDYMVGYDLSNNILD